jgi:ABC-type polysaccharide/polyol phosphate export permease
VQARLTQIWYLALAQIQRRYVHTRLGFVWLLVQPAILFSIFYLVSVYGLKMGVGDGGAPFFAVLFCGLMPWMTLNESIGGASSAFASSKTLLYDRAATPLTIVSATVLSAALIHILLFTIVAIILIVGGITPGPSWLAVLYYYFCLLALGYTVSILVAPLTAKSADAIQAVNSLMLVWFWGSPVIWPPDVVPDAILTYIRINPFFYVIEGYRGALLYGEWVPAPWPYHLVFWITIFAIGALGLAILRVAEPRLREWLMQ